MKSRSYLITLWWAWHRTLFCCEVEVVVLVEATSSTTMTHFSQSPNCGIAYAARLLTSSVFGLCHLLVVLLVVLTVLCVLHLFSRPYIWQDFSHPRRAWGPGIRAKAGLGLLPYCWFLDINLIGLNAPLKEGQYIWSKRAKRAPPSLLSLDKDLICLDTLLICLDTLLHTWSMRPNRAWGLGSRPRRVSGSSRLADS